MGFKTFLEFVFLEVTGAAVDLATGITPDVVPRLVRFDMDGDYVLIPEHSVADQTLEFRLQILSRWVLENDSLSVWNVLLPLIGRVALLLSFGSFV